MAIVEREYAPSREPRLAAELADHAVSAAPAWLWSADGSRILWANAVGAAIFDAADTNGCTTRRFDAKHPAAVEIARLAATLPPAGQQRLERLRGFGASFGRALTCVCSRFGAADGEGILVVAAEPAGPPLPLPERVRRLFAGRERPLAVFASDGALLYANDAAKPHLAGSATLSALGIAEMAAQAAAAGRAGGVTAYGPVTVDRLGSGNAAVLVAEFGAQPTEDDAAEGAAAGSQPESALATRQKPRNSSRDEPAAERRHPLRFVWQMDAEGRFIVGSDEFIELLGPRTTAAIGRLWSEIAADLKLDPENLVARAVATRETWSGVTVSWPVDDGGERLAVELSGLPVFDRDRDFRGYRGFGVCRDLAHINHLARARGERPMGFIAQREASPSEAAAGPIPEHESTEVTVPVAAPPTAATAASAAEQPAPEAAPAANVVPFRLGTPDAKAPSLSPVERKAFRDLAQELTARLQGNPDAPGEGHAAAAELAGPSPGLANSGRALLGAGEEIGAPREPSEHAPAPLTPPFEPALLDRIPLGVLVYRHDTPADVLLYANRHFLELSGYQRLDALAEAGGLDKLFAEPVADALAEGGAARSLSVVTGDGDRRPVEGRLFTVPWGGGSALALILSNGEAEERKRAGAISLTTAQNEIRELKANLEAFKKTEVEMRAATREAQKAAAAKEEFVAKLSHEIRTPLNTITGFAEVIMAERFGPIGNERYRDYLKDIYAAGMHLVSLLNDILDLSKIETGQLDLSFANVSLNELTQQCVGIMQPQASRARIIIRTSLTPGLPQVVADERSLRQIVLNLLSNSIRFTGPGGQVIVSTAFADSGEAVLRVRDTGVGMSEKDVEAALEPFRQTATSGSWGSGGTGLGLPLTKALAEANRAHFSIKSAPNAGTLVEVAFPPTRVVAR